jgi:hypothetical protein
MNILERFQCLRYDSLVCLCRDQDDKFLASSSKSLVRDGGAPAFLYAIQDQADHLGGFSLSLEGADLMHNGRGCM